MDGSRAKLIRLVALLFAGLVLSTYAGAVSLTGDLAQGGLATGQVPPGATAELLGGHAVVTDDGVLLLAVGRDFPAQAEVVVRLPSGLEERDTVAVLQREFKIQRIDGLPSRQVTPPEAVLARIRGEQVRVSRARGQRRRAADFSAGFRWPVVGPITGVYGSQRILNGQPRQPHYGVDIGVPTGTLVVAPSPGLVTLTDVDLYFSGGTLIIDHGYGLSSSFLHLSEILVEEGEFVNQGQPIAKVGATGRVTGPHLDWRMNLGGVRIDPVLVLEALPAATTGRSAEHSPN